MHLASCKLAFIVRRRWVGAIGLGVAAAASASVFACQQLVGIPGDPPAPTAVNACGLPYGNNACASCAATSCCTESSACAADPGCSSLESCLGNANGDWQARSQCALDNLVGGSSEVSPLSACLATHCTNECGLTCGGLAANYTTPDRAAACQQCVAGTSFCAPEQACASSEACDALFRCKVACATLDCIDGCLNVYDAGTAALLSLLDVFHGACSAPCAFGEDWTCVGRVSWPSSRASTITFTVDVRDFTTKGPIPGVDVSVCDSTDVDCNHPLADGGTNDAGRVVMQVPNQGQTEGFGLNGYLQMTSPTTVPELYYWGFPLSESTFELSFDNSFLNGVQLITPADLQVDALSLGVQVDSGGVVVSPPSDCLTHPAPGVQVTTNVSGLLPFYGQSPTATATDSTSIALVTFFNVPVGSLDVTAAPMDLGGKASSHESVIVRAGYITQVNMGPTPSTP